MNNTDQLILDASREVRDAFARRKAALEAVDAAKRAVAQREKEANDELAMLQAAEKRLRDVSTGDGESLSMTSKIREM